MLWRFNMIADRLDGANVLERRSRILAGGLLFQARAQIDQKQQRQDGKNRAEANVKSLPDRHC
jgi:hypothetical protein